MSIIYLAAVASAITIVPSAGDEPRQAQVNYAGRMADAKSKDVHYSDLDLSSSAGRERLQLRIRQAVKQVCGSPRAFAIKERQDIRACEKQANLKAEPEGAQIIAAYMEKRRTIESTASVAAR